MPATIILTTPDPGLEAAWKAQLAPREPTTFVRPADLHRELLRPGARVWIADINDPRTRHTAGTGTLVVLVGQPHSLPFEQARQNRAARLFLSYDESRTRLGESVSLLEEVAEKNAQLQTALERTRRLETEQQLVREPAPPSNADSGESWDFLESALEHLGDRDRLLDEFRRAGRYLLRAGKVLFFLRQVDAFVADREGHRCEAGHALPLWLEEHPAALDLGAWTGTGDPTLDSPIRQQLQTSGARVIVPLHSQSQLLGWIALGPRADGGPYREADRSRAVLLARLLERCLERHAQLDELRQNEQQAALRAKYLPGARLLSRTLLANADLPVEVRAVAGEALALKRVVHQPARAPHRFRVVAGPVPEIDGVWINWEEAAPEIERLRGEQEVLRRDLLRNLGLTLSHELSNPLVSLVTFSQMRSRGTASPLGTGGAAVAQELALASDVQKLQRLAEHASVLGELAAPVPQAIDLNQLLTEIATKHGLTTRFSEEPLAFSVDPRLLRFAFSAIFDALSANRPDEGTKNLLLTLRASGTDAHRLAVITIEGKNLELDGVLPLPEPGGTPNQGRLSVFLAHEILRLHGGSLHAGPGIKGTDIQISLGALR